MKTSLLIMVSIFGFGLIGCGSSSAPEIAAVNDIYLETDSAACEQEYFQTIIGEYRGTAEYGLFDEVRCVWDISIVISGTPVSALCLLNAQTEGNVTQLAFSPLNDLTPYECLDDSGYRRVREPISSSATATAIGVIPNLDNSHFPIEVEIVSNTTLDRGPYSYDESLNAFYYQVFDGQNINLGNNAIVEGDGTITLINSSGSFNGTLLKDQ